MRLPHNKLTLEQVVAAAKKVHGDKYDYSFILSYTNQKEKVPIGCSLHGTFCQSLFSHIHGKSGCPECAGVAKLNTEKFIAVAKEIHGNRYDYSKTEYINQKTKVLIRCKEHGDFEQLPSNHIHLKHRCPGCAEIERVSKRRLPVEDIEKRLLEMHGEKYEYFDYSNLSVKDKVQITCKKHGVFEQILWDHLTGHGCPSCGNRISLMENEINDYVLSRGFTTVRSHKLLSGKEIDIYIPEKQLGIEYNGLLWHSENYGKDSKYHVTKLLEAEKEGVHLLMIFEDEWLLHKNKVLNLLDNALGVAPRTYNARNLILDQNVSWKEAEAFLNHIHLQSAGSPALYRFGLRTSQEKLVAVMCFATQIMEEGEIELSRFATDGRIPGAFSKLLKAFLTINQGKYSSIISYSDRRWSRGEVYLTNGFIKEFHLDPRYYWCKGQKVREHRRGFQKQYLKNKLPIFDPEKTEDENCRINGYFKVWDCGLTKWRLITINKKAQDIPGFS